MRRIERPRSVQSLQRYCVVSTALHYFFLLCVYLFYNPTRYKSRSVMDLTHGLIYPFLEILSFGTMFLLLSFIAISLAASLLIIAKQNLVGWICLTLNVLPFLYLLSLFLEA